RLVRSRSLDVLVFAECSAISDAEIETALNTGGNGVYVLPRSRSERIRIWTRLPATAVEDRYNGRISNRMTIREVTFPGALPVLLVGVHLMDRQRVPTEVGRALATRELAAQIRRVENACGHARTVLIGDLNMNLYEAGVIGTEALHAVMTRELTR